MYAKTHAVHRTQEYDQGESLHSWTATLNVAKNNSNFNEFK